MQLGFLGFLGRQFTKQAPVVKTDLTGQTVLVLGANTGIGFEATKHFASMNPQRLILACRSQSRGQAAIDKLKAHTGYSKAELWLVDLANFDSVKQFADKFEREGGRLDILVENAAIAADHYEGTKDGWEISLQVNDLSTPFVALLLLPAMIRTAEQYSTFPRLVIVASEVHYWVKIEKQVYENPDILKTLGSSEYCTNKVMQSRYMLTKLLTVFFVRALNARLPPSTAVIIDMVNPGFCHSELMRDAKGVAGFMFWLFKRIVAFTAEEGSRQLVYAAVGGQPDKLRGEYITGGHVEEVADFVLSPEGVKIQNQLWDEVVDILAKVDPRVTSIVDKHLSA
ncbi:WW domain-containing oxidoreductase [Mycena venus]|uniref:WW domain-containing oxidoreductase n=1 Tax=Mycena venus TaxID=2733690 RepID=A0A8H6XP79_9AGAR|nr:WW domain-containing oxidoreductase [Mycena venus]